MKLYSFPLSPNCRKVSITAAELGLTLDTQVVDVIAGEGRKPEYLQLNPNGKVPTLVDGGFVLWESNAIMRYIAGRKPNALWPGDAQARADIARWQDWELAHWFPACRNRIFEFVIKQALGRGAPDLSEVEKGDEDLHRFAAVLNDHLASRDYLVGRALTLADISTGIWVSYTDAARLPLDSYAHIKRWYRRLESLPSWRREVLSEAA